MSDSVRPRRRQPTRLPVPGILQARVLEWGAIAFRQWFFKLLGPVNLPVFSGGPKLMGRFFNIESCSWWICCSLTSYLHKRSKDTEGSSASSWYSTSLSLFTFMHWRRKWQPTPVFLPGESQGRGASWAAVYGVAQSQTWLKRLRSSSSRALLTKYHWLMV